MQAKPAIRIRVGVVIFQDDHILLVQHHKEGRRYWLVPGGGLEFGESMGECALREVREETGLEIELGQLLFVSETRFPDASRHLVNFFFRARIVGGTLKVGVEERLAEARFVPVAELDRIPFYPPLASYLGKAARDDLHDCPVFLGTLWSD